MPMLSIHNFEIYYELTGPDNAPVVTLGNGIFADTSNWFTQAEHLSEHYRVLTFDFIGQGRSSAAENPVSPSDQAEMLTELLHSLGIKDVHYVGVSYGGEVGLTWAITQPSALKSLVLADCVASIHPYLDERVREWTQLMSSGDADKLFEISTPDIFSKSYVDANRALMSAVQRSYQTLNLESLLNLLDNYNAFDLFDELHMINVPTLFICGGEDAIKPPDVMSAMSRAVPNSEFIVIPEAGHAIHMERPHEFMTCLAGFLGKVAADTGRLK